MNHKPTLMDAARVVDDVTRHVAHVKSRDDLAIARVGLITLKRKIEHLEVVLAHADKELL